PVTLASICGELSALTIDTRGKLYAIGNRVYAFAKGRALETDKAIVDAFDTEGKLQGLKFDGAKLRAAMKASKDGKTANKHGVYAEWSNATTDSEATEILDK